MGHKFSAIHGVKSDNFYHQGNAINEIWLGNVELISRLPFGDSDRGQAGWPPGSWPKIPWHQFVIPLKRDMDSANTAVCITGQNTTGGYEVEVVQLWQAGVFGIGGGFVTLGNALLFEIFLSTSLYNLSEAMSVIRRNPSHADSQAWLERMPVAQLHSWSSILAWFYLQTLFERVLAVGVCFMFLIGYPCLFFIMKSIKVMRPFGWMLLSSTVSVLAMVIIRLAYVFSKMQRTVTKLRENSEPSAKPEDIEMAAVPV